MFERFHPALSVFNPRKVSRLVHVSAQHVPEESKSVGRISFNLELSFLGAKKFNRLTAAVILKPQKARSGHKSAVRNKGFSLFSLSRLLCVKSSHALLWDTFN